MKKKVFLIAGVLLSVSMTYGQVGIGSPVPRGALDINKKDGDKYSYDMGLVLPTNAAANNIKNAVPNNAVAPGTIFYDSTKDCVRLKQTADWSDCIGSAETAPLGVVQTLDCNNATINGTFAANVYSYGTFKIPYTGGNGKSYPAVSVNSSGVTGLTATLAPGTFENGNGTLTFVVSGIPSGEGQAIFVISVGGQTCPVIVNVVNKPGTGGGSDYARIGSYGFFSFLLTSAGNDVGFNKFTNQMRQAANYGPAGIKKTEGIFYTALASGAGVYDVFTQQQSFNNQGSTVYTQVRDFATGKKLRSSFDILEVGHWGVNSSVTQESQIDGNDFELIRDFVKAGGVAIIALDNGAVATNFYLYKTYLLNKFGLKGKLGTGSSLKIFTQLADGHGQVKDNFPGSVQNFGSVSQGEELSSGMSAQVGYKMSDLPAGSTVYAVNKNYPDYAMAFTLGGEYEGRVIFVNYGYFKGPYAVGTNSDVVIDSAQEKFMHNLIAYAMDKSKGL
ncbi:hypothetical protein ABID31_003305 [Chryseobacterium flavum]|nr:hypothetical protein [Chryseobacterium flavum]